ncbi:hypothetical protein [Pseudactinotalea sp. Z1732]|uniref:hypothetical protein n=1 Tax=Micrococcales TaxID=85006 RepID=UPI003C7DDA5D
MPDPTDPTTGYLDTGWLTPPTPGTPSHRLIDAEADLRAESEAEVGQDPSGTGLVALAWAQDRIEEALR